MGDTWTRYHCYIPLWPNILILAKAHIFNIVALPINIIIFISFKIIIFHKFLSLGKWGFQIKPVGLTQEVNFTLRQKDSAVSKLIFVSLHKESFSC